MTDEATKPSPYLYITIPADVPRLHTFVRFVEHIGDASPLFRSTSGVARLVMILTALGAAENGVARLERPCYELLVKAVVAEGDDAVSLDFGAEVELADGTTKWQPFVVPNRAWASYVTAIIDASPDEPVATLESETASHAA